MTGFGLGEFPDLIHPIVTTMVILVQDSVFEVLGNVYSSITVAFLNEKCVSCPPEDNTREVSKKVVLHPAELVSFSTGV